MPRYKQRSETPIIIITLGILLLIAAVVLGLQNIFITPTDNPHSHEETFPETPRVTLAEAKAALDARSAVFVDVRSAQAYQESHIASSINIPLAELEARINELDPARWIITYCTWPNEESSARAARTWLDNGFQNVSPILGGFEAWINASYPVEP